MGLARAIGGPSRSFSGARNSFALFEEGTGRRNAFLHPVLLRNHRCVDCPLNCATILDAIALLDAAYVSDPYGGNLVTRSLGHRNIRFPTPPDAVLSRASGGASQSNYRSRAVAGQHLALPRVASKWLRCWCARWPDQRDLHRMVNSGSLLGNATAQDRRTHSSHRVDPSRDGSFAVRCRVRRGTDRTRGLVSRDNAHCFRHFQYPRFLPRCCPDARRGTRLSHLSRRNPSSGSEHFHRLIYGTWSVLSNTCGRRICWSEIRPRLVCQLGAGLGRIWQSLCRPYHHGRLLLNHHDSSVQSARPRARLAKRRDQMVALAENEASSLGIREIRKSFPVPDDPLLRRLVLDGISFSLAAGELVSLIGPSGCGKSTLLRLIAGLESPDSGELLIGSEKITQPGAERGLVFQDPNLFPWLTVRRNIQAGLVARGVLREKHREVDDFMRLVGLETFADAYPHHLSGGMAQRVALARALINHPKVLLLDEPLGALDAFTRMRMQDEVLRLWQARGTTMLLVTHDIDEAIYMSDRIMIMTQRPGKIEQTIQIALERPRDRSSSDFLRLRGDILELLHFAGNKTVLKD